MDYDNRNKGVLFKNDKDGNERRPDYRGSINVNGQDFDLSAWIKSSKKGDKYMSLSVQPKRAPVQQVREGIAQESRGRQDFNDDIPF